MKSTKKINKIMGFLKFALPFIIVFPLIINAQEAEQAQDTEELTVSGSFIPDAKRNTSEISAILDSSDIERAGDDNIAIALTRLAGLSLDIIGKNESLRLIICCICYLKLFLKKFKLLS